MRPEYCTFLLIAFLLLSLPGKTLLAQDQSDTQIQELEEEVDDLRDEVNSLQREINSLESDIEDKAGTGFILFLFGGFCALWAQNTNRNPWLWFFLGAGFNVITVLFLLSMNSNEREVTGEQETSG